VNTSTSTIDLVDLKKPLCTPLIKKIDLKFPTGIEVTARNMKGVTIKDALDAIHKQLKKKVTYTMPVSDMNLILILTSFRLMMNSMNHISRDSNGILKQITQSSLCISPRSQQPRPSPRNHPRRRIKAKPPSR
jgi:hypothetical protein